MRGKFYVPMILPINFSINLKSYLLKITENHSENTWPSSLDAQWSICFGFEGCIPGKLIPERDEDCGVIIH